MAGSGLPDLPLSRAAGNLAPKSKNFARDIVFSDCAEPWFVYVETFVPAFLKLFLTIAFFDLADIIRWRAGEEIGKKGGGTRRRGRHMGRVHAREVPHSGRSYGQSGLRFLYIITAPIEKLGLIWLLYSAGDQFFYDWQTLIERFGTCGDDPGLGPFHRSCINSPTSILPDGQGFSMPILDQNRAGWASNSFSLGLTAGVYHAVLAVKVEAGLIDLSSVGCKIRVAGAVFDTEIESGTETVRVGEPVDLVCAGTFTLTGALPIAGVTWEIYGMLSATGVNVASGDIIVSRKF